MNHVKQSVRRVRPPISCRRQLLACGLVLVCQLASADAVLSLDEALSTAQQRSRQLPAQDAAAVAAREMAVAAGQLPDPVIKGGITNLPIDGPDRFAVTRDFMTMRSIGVMQEFTGESKRRARSARFERAAEIASAARTVALAKLQQDTALAWIERMYMDHLLELLQAQRSEAQLLVEAAEAVYRGGKGSQTDIFAARTAVAQIDDRIQQALLEVGTARIRLLRWVGESANRPLGQAPQMSSLRLDIARLERQLESHPQIAFLSRQEAAARADADLAQANRKSDWSVELMYSQRGPAYSNMLSLTFAVPLQWDRLNRQDREVGASLALFEKIQAEREEALREVVALARTMLAELQSSQARLDNYDKALIPLAEQRIAAALADYRGGAGPLVAVLEARRMLIDTRIERLRIEISSAGQWARLNYMIPSEAGVIAAMEK